MVRRGARTLPLVVVATLSLAAGCSDSSPPPAAAPAPSSTVQAPGLPACAADAGGELVTATTSAGETTRILVIGTGTEGVVLGPQDDGDLCQWLPYAEELAATYRVALFDWAEPRADLPALAVDALRDAGAREVVLGGASFGGATAMSEAYAVRPPLAGVLSLGGELTLPGGFDFRGGIRKWEGPLLQISSVHDDFFGRDEVTRLRRIHPGPEEVVMLPGSRHGVDLLEGQHAGRVRATIEDYLARVLG